jgi:hypothetical protein
MGGEELVLLVCYACNLLEIRAGGQSQMHYLVSGHRELKAEMNRLLREGGVPLAVEAGAEPDGAPDRGGMK